MLTSTKILTTIGNAKYAAGQSIIKIVAQEGFGEDDTIQKLKFTILTKWTQILENYYNNNFDANGTLSTPIFDCLNEDQAAELMSKINILICGVKAPTQSDWLLITGFWDDTGFWRDTAVWWDVKPII